MSRKHIRELRSVVEPLGLEVVQAKAGHFHIRDKGAFVATVAGSPKNADHCVQRAFRDAINYLDKKESA